MAGPPPMLRDPVLDLATLRRLAEEYDAISRADGQHWPAAFVDWLCDEQRARARATLTAEDPRGSDGAGDPAYTQPMRLRERLEIRDLADGVYHAHAGEQYELQALADVHGEDAVLGWLRFGPPTPRLDLPILSDLLAAGVTAQRYAWLLTGRT